MRQRPSCGTLPVDRRHLRQNVSEQWHNLNRVNGNEVGTAQIAGNDAPVHKGKPDRRRRRHRVRTAREHVSAMALPGQEITMLYRIAETIGRSINPCARDWRKTDQHPTYDSRVNMTCCLSSGQGKCPTANARKLVSAAPRPALPGSGFPDQRSSLSARRTSVSCHLGICNASNSRLMVEAKVRKTWRT